MASIILAAAGTAIGGSVGGSILGVSAAAIGGAVGSIAGAAIDSWLVASMAPTQRIAGQRLDTLQITASTEGAVIPRVFGAMRTGGNIIWATDFVPGALLLFRMRTSAVAKHCGIVTTPDRFIHAYERSGVVEVALDAGWRWRIAFAFLFPDPS